LSSLAFADYNSKELVRVDREAQACSGLLVQHVEVEIDTYYIPAMQHLHVV